MELYHSSANEIKKVTASGVFGSFLFFSSEIGHGAPGDALYKIEIDDEMITDSRTWFYGSEHNWANLSGMVEQIMDLMSCDEDTAQEYLSQRRDDIFQIMKPEDARDASWEIQKLTAQAAKALGYRGVKVPDEHGISYMIDMLGRESELVKIGKKTGNEDGQKDNK
jgi:hypothetical protein